jgi:hypothetical protein
MRIIPQLQETNLATFLLSQECLACLPCLACLLCLACLVCLGRLNRFQRLTVTSYSGGEAEQHIVQAARTKNALQLQALRGNNCTHAAAANTRYGLHWTVPCSDAVEHQHEIMYNFVVAFLYTNDDREVPQLPLS